MFVQCHSPYPAANTELTPSIKDLSSQVVPFICPMWKDIGLHMDLNIAILNEIEYNHLSDVRKCCTRMFEEWLKQDTKASWSTVLSALKKVTDNLSSGPDEAVTNDHIKALTSLISTLPDFLATL